MSSPAIIKEATREFEYTERDFARLRALVFKLTHIHLSDDKKQLTYSRFTKRLRTLKLKNFKEYIDLVESGDPEEVNHFIVGITTNFTSFFREPHHFAYLTELAKRPNPARKLRVWSAGCSSGEEPYSIAMTLLDAIPDIHNWDVKILATDINTEVLATAANGIYPVEKLNNIPETTLRKWFIRGRKEKANQVQLSPRVKELISFKQLNLFDEWPMRGPFDIIFCRNVIIYFQRDVQMKLFRKFAQMQRPGQSLIVGHSENLMGVTDKYKLIGKTIYHRINPTIT